MENRGRPRKFKQIRLVSFNIETDLLNELDDYCKVSYYNRSSCINKAISLYLELNKVRNDE